MLMFKNAETKLFIKLQHTMCTCTFIVEATVVQKFHQGTIRQRGRRWRGLFWLLLSEAEGLKQKVTKKNLNH